MFQERGQTDEVDAVASIFQNARFFLDHIKQKKTVEQVRFHIYISYNSQ